MNCEEFESVGLGTERDSTGSAAERAAAEEHASTCLRCAALQQSWLVAKLELSALSEATRAWRNWEKTRREEAAKHNITLPNKPTEAAPGGTEASGQNQAQNNASATLTSGSDEREFTLLPGSVPADTEDAAIWRVRMQRGALSALGFSVNEDRAGEWIQVDLLVGNDGLPQGVRLAR